MTRLARLCGLALDARAATKSSDPVQLAIAARWIARNLLAIRGIRIGVEGVIPVGARVLGVRVASLNDMLAAIAAVPALIDATTVPLRWRLALRALGLPILDRPAPLALAAGASVVVYVSPHATTALHVDTDSSGYRVRVANAQCKLAA